jgi:hypothetical protein
MRGYEIYKRRTGLSPHATDVEVFHDLYGKPGICPYDYGLKDICSDQESCSKCCRLALEADYPDYPEEVDK